MTKQYRLAVAFLWALSASSNTLITDSKVLDARISRPTQSLIFTKSPTELKTLKRNHASSDSKGWRKARKRLRKKKPFFERLKRNSRDSEEDLCALGDLKRSNDVLDTDGIKFEIYHPWFSVESYVTHGIKYRVRIRFNTRESVRFLVTSDFMNLRSMSNDTGFVICNHLGIGGEVDTNDSLVFESSLSPLASRDAEYIQLKLISHLNNSILVKSLIRRIASGCELNVSPEAKELFIRSMDLPYRRGNGSSCKIYFPRNSEYEALLVSCDRGLTGSSISGGEKREFFISCGSNTTFLRVSSLELSAKDRFELLLRKKTYGCSSDPVTILGSSKKSGTFSSSAGCRIIFKLEYGFRVRLREENAKTRYCSFLILGGTKISSSLCSYELKDNPIIVEFSRASNISYEIYEEPNVFCSNLKRGLKSPTGAYCVKLHVESSTFRKAGDVCKLEGGELFEANSIKTYTWIYKLVQKSISWNDDFGIWIRGKDEEEVGCEELSLVRDDRESIQHFHRVNVSCVKSNWFLCAAKLSPPATSTSRFCQKDIYLKEEGYEYFQSPNYPTTYPANVNCTFNIFAPEGYWINLEFERFNLESEEKGECLYDFLKIGLNWTRCGAFHRKFFKFFKSELKVNFVSDYSNEFNGYKAKVNAQKLPLFNRKRGDGKEWIEVPYKSNCYNRTLTNMSGKFVLSASLEEKECFLIISAPTNHRVILTVPKTKKALNCSENEIKLHFSSEEFLPWCPNHGDNFFLSYASTLIITYKNLNEGSPPPFVGHYQLEHFQLQHLHPDIRIFENNITEIRNVNFPLNPPYNLVLVTRLVSVPGLNIELTVFGRLAQRNQNCTKSYLEVEDPYQKASFSRKFCHWEEGTRDPPGSIFDVKSQLRLRSFFNILIIRQVTSKSDNKLQFGIFAHASSDAFLKRKVSQMSINTCDTNLCFNGGSCRNGKKNCKCSGHFVGKNCLETACDRVTCQNGGSCVLTSTGFKCACAESKFGGKFCQKILHPCERNPCGGRGICQLKNEEDFVCQCHLWWTGPKCDRRMKHIPFKPLSKRMLEEPFWLGLITVTVVLNILGVGWFVKKHLSDRIERFFLSETASKDSPLVKNIEGGHVSNHPYELTPQNSNSSDWLDGHLCSTEASPTLPQSGACSSSGKTLLGRLSARKTSLLSFSSNASSPINGEKKQFDSQEEIFLKRSPSAHTRLSTATAEEKRLILKKLIYPTTRANSENSFTSLLIKATRSAENISERANSVSGVAMAGGSNPSISNQPENYRKDSALSLQIPVTIFGGTNKKVTFSRIVDQMASTVSGSSSLSDVSSLDLDLRKPRKLLRSNRITSGSKTTLPPPLGGSKKIARKTHSLPGNYGATSASEEVQESSMESIDSNSPSSFVAPLGASSGTTKKSNNRLLKISSADSLISMIRSLAVNRNAVSTPSSPQLSTDGGDWGNDESPGSSRHNSLKVNHLDVSSPHQIQVEVVNHHQPSDKNDSSSLKSSATGSSSTHSGNAPSTMSAPSITLEVPNFQYGQLLSPIKELPSPIPTPLQTPIPSPLPHHRSGIGSRRNSAGGENIQMALRRSSSTSRRFSCSEEETTFTSPAVPPIVITSHCDNDEESEKDDQPTQVFTMTSPNLPSSDLKEAPPFIIISSHNFNSDDEEDNSGNKNRPTKFSRPLIKQQGVELPFDSAPRSRSQSIEIKSNDGSDKEWRNITIGSPPVKRVSDKPGLLPIGLIDKAPIITITPTTEERTQKSTNPIHPSSLGHKTLNSSFNNNFLSPYSHIPEYGGVRTTSDSNLSSSGYSSMASPSSSRSGSLNPLSENEENHHVRPHILKRSGHSILRTNTSVDSESSETQPTDENEKYKTLQQFIRDRRMSFIRTDSETTDEMYLSESLHTDMTQLPFDESLNSSQTNEIPTIILSEEEIENKVERGDKAFLIPEIAIEPSTPISSSPPPLDIRGKGKIPVDTSSSLQNIRFFSSEILNEGLNRNCSSTGCLSDFRKSDGGRYKRLESNLTEMLSLDSAKSAEENKHKSLSGGRRVVSEGTIDFSSSNESLRSNNSNHTWDGRLAIDSLPSSSDETDTSIADTLTNQSFRTSSSSSPPITNSPLESKASLLRLPPSKKPRRLKSRFRRKKRKQYRSKSQALNKPVIIK